MRCPPTSSPFKALAALLAASLLAGCDVLPDAPQQHAEVHQAMQASVLPPSPDERTCLADLGARDASFSPIPDQYYGGGCSQINAVRLLSVQSDGAALGVTGIGAVTCPLANSFAGWARYGVDRAARQILGSPLVRIETLGSYNCRNVAGTDRRSAHSTANAIDVSAFDLADGRRITVLGDWFAGTSSERMFLNVIHQSACKRFGTVLGPGYNAAHRDHFHVELSSGAFCR